MDIKTKVVTVLIGGVLLWILGIFVTCIMNSISTKRPNLKKDERQQLAKIEPPKHEYADKWLGVTERLIAFAAAWLENYLIIGGWLTFKIAAKWENWKNIIRLSSEDVPSPKVRRYLGGYVYTRFLIGTGLNIIVGISSSKIAVVIAPEITKYL